MTQKISTSRMLIFDGNDDNVYWQHFGNSKEFNKMNFPYGVNIFDAIIKEIGAIPVGNDNYHSSEGQALFFEISIGQVILVYSNGEKQPFRYNVYLEGIWMVNQKFFYQ